MFAGIVESEQRKHREKHMRLIYILAALWLLSASAHAAFDEGKVRDRAKEVALKMEHGFGCEKRECLAKAVPYGGAANAIPEPYRAMMERKFSILTSGSKQDGQAVAGILATFIGACTWHPDECGNVMIVGAEHNAGDNPRHTSFKGTRSFTLVGFRSIAEEVRFLTRMALVAEAMELKLNAGLGFKDDIQIADVDVNGHEVDVKTQCHEECSWSGKGKKKHRTCDTSCFRTNGSVTWSVGPLAMPQALFHLALQKNSIPDLFLVKIFGDKQYVFPTVQALTTFYAPGSDSKIEGLWKTFLPNEEGAVDSDGDGVPRTLDDVRLAKYDYVSLASDPINFGKYFDMGPVTYTSPIDRLTYTGDPDVAAKTGALFSFRLMHVIGLVHDTGAAFNPETCARWHTCGLTTYKFDVAVGDFRGWPGKEAEKFVDDKDKQTYGGNAIHIWQEIPQLPVPLPVRKPH